MGVLVLKCILWYKPIIYRKMGKHIKKCKNWKGKRKHKKYNNGMKKHYKNYKKLIY